MTIHITNLDKYRYVCGLFWQSLSRPRELEREAVDLGRKIDADLMVVRMDHTTAQAGFAQTRDGARPGMYSLAAVVSRTMAREGAFYDGEQQPVHNWLGAFKLPDGCWVYFAVRDANFLPNGDFAGSREEVLERLQSDYALGGWNVVVGEEELRAFGFHNFQMREIRSFIPQKADGSLRAQRRAALRRIGGRLSRTHLIVAGVAVLAAGGGYAWMLHQRDLTERERELAMQLVRERILREAPAAVVVRPWDKRPAPPALARACMQAFRHPTAGGWQLESYTCTQKQSVHAWRRGESSVAMLRDRVPDVDVEPSGERANYVQPLQLPTSPAEDLLDRRRALEPVLSHMQMMGVPIKVTAVPVPVVHTDPPPPPQSWRGYSFSLQNGGVEPQEIARLLDRPGIRVDRMVYQGSQWTMEGTIYAE